MLVKRSQSLASHLLLDAFRSASCRGFLASSEPKAQAVL